MRLMERKSGQEPLDGISITSDPDCGQPGVHKSSLEPHSVMATLMS